MSIYRTEHTTQNVLNNILIKSICLLQTNTTKKIHQLVGQQVYQQTAGENKFKNSFSSRLKIAIMLHSNARMRERSLRKWKIIYERYGGTEFE